MNLGAALAVARRHDTTPRRTGRLHAWRTELDTIDAWIARRLGTGAAVPAWVEDRRAWYAAAVAWLERRARPPLVRKADRPRCGAPCRDGTRCRAPAAWDRERNAPQTGRCRRHRAPTTAGHT